MPIDLEDTFLVLVAIDHSEHSTRAFDYYVKNLHQSGNRVILLHIPEMQPISATTNAMLPGSMHLSPKALEGLWKRREEQVKELQDKFDDRLKQHKVSGKWIIPQNKLNPGEGIVHAAREHRAHMVVMGSRGSGKIRRTILGSVSDYVLHHAHVPVIVCRH